ncbi:hypothetical protein, partial [Anabaena sp. UHCC 0399]|uniref:hypothetical protein n=1 Tax=Anabaena sp. UHCC 0399 TaxID=3110238 RepID=UPI002B1F2EE8
PSAEISSQSAIPSTSFANAPNTEVIVIQTKNEPKIIQSRNTNIPRLPKALKKLSILKPLSQSSNLLTSNLAEDTSTDIQNTVPITSISPHKIQKSPTENIPNSWSSLAELMDEMEMSATNHSEKIVIQPQTDKKQWNKVIPITSKRSPTVGRTLSHSLSGNELSQTEINFPPKNNSKNQSIQTYSNPFDFTLIQKTEDSYTEESTNNDSTEEETENLEILAQEIYKLLRQRLEIERERRGNNYSGRLPW